jgi:hypothetical protein
MTFLSQLPFDLKCEIDHHIHKEKFNKIKEELGLVTEDISYCFDFADLTDCRIGVKYFRGFLDNNQAMYRRRRDTFYWYWVYSPNVTFLPDDDVWVGGNGINQIKEILKSDNLQLSQRLNNDVSITVAF